MAEGSAGGQEQIPRSGNTPSKVWDHFTRFTTADGQAKAKCNNCSAELVASTKKHGTKHLWRHVNSCRKLWEHFTRVTTADGEGKAKCKNCSAELVADNKLLSRHDKSCRKLATDGTRGEHPPRPRAASESSNMIPDDRGACEDIARMIALHGYDSSIVEDDYFRTFVRHLNPDFQMPSRRTVEEICEGILDEAKRDLSSKLKRTSGGVNLAFGTAQTVLGTVFYIACNFIDDEWKFHKMIMDVNMAEPHPNFFWSQSGICLICFEDYDSSAEELMDTVSTWGIEHKVFSTAVGRVGDYLPLSECLGDVFGTYQSKMTQLRTTYMDDVLHSIAKQLKDHVNSEFIDDYLMDYPSSTRQERQDVLSNLGLHDRWTYNENWYSFYCSLEIVHRGPSSMSALSCRGRQKAAFAELLRKLFGAICRAIQTISAPSSPTSNLCLKGLFMVREVLQSELEGAYGDKADVYEESNGFDEDVADVLEEAKSILDKSIQESYLVWSIPLVLDPRYKLRYIESNFNNAFESGAATYVSEVETKIKEIFSDYNQDDKETSNEDSNCLTDMDVDSTVSLEHLFSDEDESELQYDESVLLKRTEEQALELEPELDRYLEEVRVPETDDFDILKWWKDHSSTYPTVARMARDALAMPTCSKLSSELMSHIRSRVRGDSEEPFVDELSEEEEE